MKAGNPLMWPQQQCQIIDQLYPSSGVNTIGGVVTIDGAIDVARLQAAIQSAIYHFDALRMRFVQGNDGEVLSQVLPFQPHAIRHMAFDTAHAALHPRPIETFLNDWLRQPFTLLESDLFEFVTFSCGEQQGGYLFKAHHGIADGWSMALLSDQVKRAYEHPDASQQAPAYLSFVAQQNAYQASARFAADRAWWRAYIEEYRDCFPEKTPISATQGISCSVWLDTGMINRIYRLCDRYHCSLNTLFIALFALYRGRVWGEEKGVVCVPLSNRHSREARRCFGMFTNHMPLAYRLETGATFGELVSVLQSALERGFKHSKYPLMLFNQDLAECGSAHLRAFDYCVNYYNFTYEREIAGAAQHVESYYSGEQSYKLQVVLQTVNDHKESLRLSIEALSSEFAPRQLTALQNGLLDLVTALNGQPLASLRDLSVYPEAIDGGRPEVPRPLFNALFALQVADHGERIALRDNDTLFTYRQLDREVEQIAHYFCQQGVRQGQVVGIAAERSAHTVIAILAILRGGAAFLPLNPALPAARLQTLCRKADVVHILCDAATRGLAQTLGCPVSSLTPAGDEVDVSSEPLPTVMAHHLAYVLFTSGSTGEPKGVQVSQGNLANYLHFAAGRYFTAQDQAALYSSLSFDLTITTLFAPLCVGASISVCRPDDSEALLRRAVVEQHNTFIKLTPAHLRLLCVAGIGSERIRTIVVGGEDFKCELARKAAVLFPHAAIFNEYGPTEATVGCMVYRYTGRESQPSLPIGEAIDGCRVTVCAPWGCPVPEGESGELVISGASVTQGYIAAPQQTAVAYLKDEEHGDVIGYRSGDIGYMMDPHTLAYVGRYDDQIKINGYRIELREIERLLLSAPQVAAAAVAVAHDAQGDPSALLACVTPESVDIASVMHHLRLQLPAYMLPRQCIALAQLPLSQNGKVDTQALAAYARQQVSPAQSVRESDDAMRCAIRDSVENALQHRAFKDDDNLYLLGLDSIKSIQIAAQLRRQGWFIPAVQVMECGTVNEIGAFLACHSEASAPMPPVTVTRVNLPAVHWFHRLVLKNIDFYNHVIVLKMLSSCAIEVLRESLQTLLEQQPALRCALSDDGLLTVGDVQSCYPHGVLREFSAMQWTLDTVIAEVNTSLDVRSGRLFAAAYLRGAPQDSDRLVLCAHHLGVDIHSWYLILSALDASISSPVSIVPDAPNSGIQRWSDYLAQKSIDAATYEYWRELSQTPPPQFPPVGDPAATLPCTHLWNAEFRHPCVGRLLLDPGKEASREAETRLLTALAPVLRHYSRDAHCRIDMEGVGRGCWTDEPDVADVVGWFTAFYPCVIPLGGDFDTLLPEIRAGLALRPHGGGSFGVLQMHNRLERGSSSGLRLNYIGADAHPPLQHFQIDQRRSDIYSAPENPLGCVLELNISLTAVDSLSFRCRFDPARITLNEVQRLLARYNNSLVALDAWLRKHTASGTKQTDAPVLWSL